MTAIMMALLLAISPPPPNTIRTLLSVPPEGYRYEMHEIFVDNICFWTPDIVKVVVVPPKSLFDKYWPDVVKILSSGGAGAVIVAALLRRRRKENEAGRS